MSLRDKIFGRREPIKRYGGIDRLVKDIAGEVDHMTLRGLDLTTRQIRDLPSQALQNIEQVVHIFLWTMMARELCRYAALWAPSNPHKFTDRLCASIAKQAWGHDPRLKYDPSLKEVILGGLVNGIEALVADEEDVEAGKTEESTRFMGAFDRALQVAVKELDDVEAVRYEFMVLILACHLDCGTASIKALEKIGAINKDGRYMG